MPCGARLEVVQETVEREGDVHVSDHVDMEVRILPVLPKEDLDRILREELEARGWTRESDGSMSKVFGEAIATLPVGSNKLRLETQEQREVRITAEVKANITEGDESARADVKKRAEEAGDRKLEQAQEVARKELIKAQVDKLLGVLEEVQGEIKDSVNATTKRGLEQRAAELGSIESVREGRASDGSYELAILVKT